MDTETKRVGLQCLDDEVLSQIVEVELDNHGELKTVEARQAFMELSRRSQESE